MIYLAAVIVIGTLVAMASGKIPPVLALGSGLAVAGITRVASPADLFAGLSNGGVITVAAMLVIAKGIMQTGIVTRATWRLLSTVTSARQALRRLLVPVGIASALMNSTPLGLAKLCVVATLNSSASVMPLSGLNQRQNSFVWPARV